MPIGSQRAGRAHIEYALADGKFRSQLAGLRTHVMRAGNEMQRIGRQGLTAGLSVAAGFAFPLRTFISFDDQMRLVGAVTQSTEEKLASLTDTAKRLGATTSFSASQVAGAMVELGRAGFDSDQIEGSIASILDLSRSTGTELPQAAEIAAAAIRSFNLDVAEAGRVSDVLSLTANKSAQTLVDLHESMKFVAPIAQSAGESIESTAAAIAILANNGIKGSNAGTALARVFKNMATEGGAKDAEGNFRSLADILTEIDHHTANMGSGDRLEIFENLFGRGSAAALKLAQGTRGALADLTAELENAGGSARTTAEQMESGLGGVLRLLLSGAEALQIQLGASTGPTFKALGQIVTASAEALRTWIADNAEAAKIVVISTAAVIGLSAALVAAVAAINFMLTPVGALAAGTVGLISVWGTLREVMVAGIEAIGNRLAAGDMEGALRVATSGMNLLWQEFVSEIRIAWSGVASEVARIWFHAMAAVQKLTVETQRFIGDAFDVVVGELAKIGEPVEVQRIIDEQTARSVLDRGINASGRLDPIRTELDANLRGATAGRDDSIRAAQKDLDNARAAWQAATSAAESTEEAAGDSGLGRIAEAIKAAAGLGGGLFGGDTPGVTSAGIFSARALQSLQSAALGPQDRTAKATEKSVQLLREVADNTKDGFAFAN